MRLGFVLCASLLVAGCVSSHETATHGEALPRPTPQATLARSLVSFPVEFLSKTHNGHRLLLSFLAFGVLGPQRVMAAIVPLDPGGGNQGPSILQIYGVRGGRPVLLDTIDDGSADFSITDGRLRVDVPDFGNGQPRCCPTQHRISRYGISGGRIFLEQSNLAMYSPTPAAPATAAPATAAPMIANAPAASKRSISWDASPSSPAAPTQERTRSDLVQVPAAEADCDDDTIQTVTEDGSYIITDLDHKYHVEPGDEATSMTWLPTEDILICGDRIINRDESESVAISPY